MICVAIVLSPAILCHPGILPPTHLITPPRSPNVLDKWKSPSVLEREEKDAVMRERCASCIALGEIDRTYFLFGPGNPLRRGAQPWLAARVRGQPGCDAPPGSPTRPLLHVAACVHTRQCCQICQCVMAATHYDC